MRQNLLRDYGSDILSYLTQLSITNSLSQNHLNPHKITGVYRAKMVDWMVEVLTAFKCADQTFFLAVSLMDRYFDIIGKSGRSFELNELHPIGIVCMFIASKYEDIFPLLMKTVVGKIGHGKIAQESIL
jgi:hypothetical protein